MLLKFFNFASNLIIPTGSSELLLGEVLADNTIKLRRWLLVGTALSFYMTTAKMVPTKISALGIEFSAVNQQQFLKISGFVLLYFLVSFFIYAFMDLFRWINGLLENRKRYFETIRNDMLSREVMGDDEVTMERAKSLRDQFIEPLEFTQSIASPFLLILATLRTIWDVLLPLAAGGYSLLLLWD
jgi:hypothetical protein